MLFSEAFTTLEASVVPVSVPAAAGTVMSALPSNNTPLMFAPGESRLAIVCAIDLMSGISPCLAVTFHSPP